MWISAPGNGGPTPRNLTHVKRTRTIFSGFKYVFWGRPSINSLFLDPDLAKYRDLYHSATPHICKCDIARYMVLYQQGGIYADLDVNFDRVVPDWMLQRDLLFFSEYDPTLLPDRIEVDGYNLVPYHVANSLIGSKPRHPFWLRLLDSIQRDYDEGRVPEVATEVVAVTGPRKLALLLIVELRGESSPLTSGYRPLDPLYIDKRRRNTDRLAILDHRYGSMWQLEGYANVLMDFYRDTYLMTVIAAVLVVTLLVVWGQNRHMQR